MVRYVVRYPTLLQKKEKILRETHSLLKKQGKSKLRAIEDFDIEESLCTFVRLKNTVNRLASLTSRQFEVELTSSQTGKELPTSLSGDKLGELESNAEE